MRPAPLPRLAAGLGLALLLAGCGSADAPTAPGATSSGPAATATTPAPSTPSAAPSLETVAPVPGKKTPVTVVGTLEEGVESGCFVLEDEVTGEIYSVSHEDMSELGEGTRVKVTGHTDPDMVSYCQQGTVLVVDEVTDPDAG